MFTLTHPLCFSFNLLTIQGEATPWSYMLWSPTGMFVPYH